MAASPAFETARLLTVFGVGIDLIRAFALLLMAASALMLFVALAQALEDRRYDLAILRTLGASRTQVALVLLAESLMRWASGRGCRRPHRWRRPHGGGFRRNGRSSRWRSARVYWPHCGPRGAPGAWMSRPRSRMGER